MYSVVYAERRIAGWTCEKIRAISLGSNSIGKEGFIVITCDEVPTLDMVTGSTSGIVQVENMKRVLMDAWGTGQLHFWASGRRFDVPCHKKF